MSSVNDTMVNAVASSLRDSMGVDEKSVQIWYMTEGAWDTTLPSVVKAIKAHGGKIVRPFDQTALDSLRSRSSAYGNAGGKTFVKHFAMLGGHEGLAKTLILYATQGVGFPRTKGLTPAAVNASQEAASAQAQVKDLASMLQRVITLQGKAKRTTEEESEYKRITETVVNMG